MRHLHFFTTSLLISLVAFGCDVDSAELAESAELVDSAEIIDSAELVDSAESVDSEEPVDMFLIEPSDDGEEVNLRAVWKDELGKAVLGESPDDPSTDADCVYVQWCNEPGPNGTICRLRSGCQVTQTTVNECIADTNAVCGSPVYPWYIY